MSFQTGTASSYTDLLNKLDAFLTGTGMALEASYAGVGNGTISGLLGGSAGVAEVITVTLTSATAFSVSGSVSGSLGSGTVGTTFTSTKVSFLITAGGTAFSNGDKFTFSVTPPWTSLLRTAGSEMIWQAPGNGGLDQIIVGAQTFSDTGGDYYNWRLGGFTAFDSSLAFNAQAGYVGGSGQSAGSPVLNLWNSSIPYWFAANGRRVIVVAQVSTVFTACYLGFINAYMSPGAFSYPLAVGGSEAFQTEPAQGSANWRWSYTGAAMSEFAIPQTNVSADSISSLRLRLATGTWRGFGIDSIPAAPEGHVFPYCGLSPSSWDWRPDLDGGYALLPIVLADGTPNVYGELDGVFAVTGFSNAAGNTVTIGGITYLVVQNVYQATKASFFAVQLA